MPTRSTAKTTRRISRRFWITLHASLHSTRWDVWESLCIWISMAACAVLFSSQSEWPAAPEERGKEARRQILRYVFVRQETVSTLAGAFGPLPTQTHRLLHQTFAQPRRPIRVL